MCFFSPSPTYSIFLCLLIVLYTGDDVSVPRSQGALTGRRGLAGTVLTYKIAGSLATKGASLDEVEYLAKMISESCGTMGMGLEHCHVPGTEKSEEYLEENQAEIGMGIVSSSSSHLSLS